MLIYVSECGYTSHIMVNFVNWNLYLAVTLQLLIPDIMAYIILRESPLSITYTVSHIHVYINI